MVIRFACLEQRQDAVTSLVIDQSNSSEVTQTIHTRLNFTHPERSRKGSKLPLTANWWMATDRISATYHAEPSALENH